MTDSPDLSAVLAHIQAQARHDGLGQVVMMTSPFSRQGTSYVARDIALRAVQMGYSSVFLADMDLTQGAQAAYFTEPSIQNHFGAVQGPYLADFGQSPFWQISETQTPSDYPAMTLGIAGQSGVSFTQFDWAKLAPGQTVSISAAPDYWAAVRRQYALTIIDAPAIDRGQEALLTAPDTDGVILVTQSAYQASDAVKTAAQSVSNFGGTCWGLVINDGVPVSQPQLTA